MMMLVDIGNSRVKYTLNHQPYQIQAITHDDSAALISALTQQSVTQLCIAHGRSQSTKQFLQSLQSFADKNGIAIAIVACQPKLLAVNYQDISQFGTDRFLNLLAAKQHFSSNFCVVSCGTAITLDFYTDKHIGGMILPGLMTSQQLLSDKAGLQDIAPPDNLLGDDTATSIGAGIYIGLQNLIYSSIKRIEKQHKATFTTILTGGDAKTLWMDGKIIDTLLFEGMNHYLTANQKKSK